MSKSLRPISRYGQMRLAVILFATGAFAQAQPVIEAARVKANHSGLNWVDSDNNPTRVRMVNMPLRAMIRIAYDVFQFKIVGGPDWMVDENWDLEMKTDVEATREQRLALLQTLLADRFKLGVHWDMRDMQKYRLVLAKAGK